MLFQLYGETALYQLLGFVLVLVHERNVPVVVHPFMNSRSISTYSNLQFFLISDKECALAHSCACGGRLRHLHCTPQCASLAERFIY